MRNNQSVWGIARDIFLAGFGFLVIAAVTGCGAAAPNVAVGVGIGSILGFNSPTNEISQVYYVGIFDPQEQLPAQFYRLTVRGQASFWSNVRFATGWVPAQVVDSLNNRISLDANDLNQDPVKALEAGQKEASLIQTGRRLVLFGPEGFREAPKDYRLVVVMGASPHAFFDGVDQVLGLEAAAKKAVNDATLNATIMQAIGGAQAEQSDLKLLEAEVNRDLGLPVPSSGAASQASAKSPATQPVTITVSSGTTTISGGEPTVTGGTTTVTSPNTTISGGQTTVGTTQPSITPTHVAISGGTTTVNINATQAATQPAVAITGGVTTINATTQPASTPNIAITVTSPTSEKGAGASTQPAVTIQGGTNAISNSTVTINVATTQPVGSGTSSTQPVIKAADGTTTIKGGNTTITGGKETSTVSGGSP